MITKLNLTSATRTKATRLVTTQNSVPGRRVRQKVRRRLRTWGLLRLYPAALFDIRSHWAILMSLAHGNMQAFQTERRLRSAELQDLHVCALLRSTMLLDDPPRTLVRSILKRLLKFRDRPFPKSGVPLMLPFWVITSLKNMCRSGSTCKFKSAQSSSFLLTYLASL